MARFSSLSRMAAAGLLFAASTAQASGVLTVAMTAGDIQVTSGNPDQGFEGFRSVADNLCDALINWDLSSADKLAVIKPGLATEWRRRACPGANELGGHQAACHIIHPGSAYSAAALAA